MSGTPLALDRLQRQVLAPWRRLPLLDRWLLGELFGPLVYGVAAFTAVSLSVGAVFELVRRVAESGLPLDVALQVLLLELPSFLVLSFPMATLMATLLTFSKLSGNSELTALRSVGVPTWRMVMAAVALSLVMTLLTFGFNEAVVPRTLSQAEATLSRAIGRAVAGEQKDNVLYSRYGRVEQPDGSTRRGLTHIFYAQRFNQGVMEDVTLVDMSRSAHRVMLTAKRARWSDAEAQWEFLDGRVFGIGGADSDAITSARFDRYLYPLGNQPMRVAKLPTDANEMTIGQARTAERLLRESGDEQAARKLRVRIEEKFAFPAVCLVFGLIGSSLGARPHSRRSRSQGFGLSVLLIFGYYLVAFSFSSLGVKGTLEPLFSAWLPVVIGLVTGFVLLRQASR
ncbi:LptF/LptG family permease [Cyanobium sp. NS01]|uniref:LptF/LptG family permease n=1 Tax=unclassified Cyanobium TaxID=2627006 RepID=UPI00185F473D|nr:LptF/LptG family permease [Cyanobium sp. NS01]QNI70494.1 lipopolysaccharide export system/ permease component [Cyanobium sp. NS01]